MSVVLNIIMHSIKMARAKTGEDEFQFSTQIGRLAQGGTRKKWVLIQKKHSGSNTQLAHSWSDSRVLRSCVHAIKKLD